MTHSPIAPKLAAAILSLWFTLATAGSATDQTSPTPSAAYGDYRDYLTFRRFRIDAESHPDPASRESAAASAAALAAKVDALDLEKLRDTIRNSNRDRQRILQLLRAMSDQASAQELEAEAQRLQLAREQDQADGTPAPDSTAAGTAIEKLEQRISWLREKLEWATGEIIAISRQPGESASAAELYAKLIRLEEARCRAGALTNPQERRLAVASVELQQQRLRGTDLEAARRALAPRQRTLATRELQAKLGAIPARPLAMAKSHPEKSRRLLALQQLYKSEIGALRADGRPPDAE